MSETVVLKVAMSCQGCVGAVQRVLTKMEGVDSFDINKEEQKVTVIGNVKPEDVFQTVSKTGKRTSFWEPEPASEIPKTEPESTTPIAETPKTEPEVTTTVTPDTSTPPPQTTA